MSEPLLWLVFQRAIWFPDLPHHLWKPVNSSRNLGLSLCEDHRGQVTHLRPGDSPKSTHSGLSQARRWHLLVKSQTAEPHFKSNSLGLPLQKICFKTSCGGFTVREERSGQGAGSPQNVLELKLGPCGGIPGLGVSKLHIPGGRCHCSSQPRKSLPAPEILGVRLGWKVPLGHRSRSRGITDSWNATDSLTASLSSHEPSLRVWSRGTPPSLQREGGGRGKARQETKDTGVRARERLRVRASAAGAQECGRTHGALE